jgi:hypothetical protein
MGILDDAIREHLELKRKHGVPEEEVERQEEEALGPARREVAQQPEDADIAADEAAPTVATGGAAPSPDDDTVLFDGEPSGPAPVDEHEPASAEPLADAPLADAPLADAPPFEEPEPVEPPVADHTGLEPPPADDAVLGDTEPHGFPAVEEDAEPDEADEPVEDADEDDGEPDVLEDTPDFLQETPEHDRLWFEQKPPRDFDFD